MRVIIALGLALFMISAARASDPQAFEQIEHGRYLAVVADCAACHTADGGAPYAGGKPIETPFGTLVAPNITPDPSTGIGTMSDETFVRALQKGIGRGGRHLYPAMPYPYYTRMSRADLLAIRAWLNTLPPRKHAVV
jgi:mono/diheme cytochrome c family protein